jgi:hypothetical protein
MRLGTFRHWSLLVLLGATHVGCATARSATPEAALQAWRAAVTKGDGAGAARLLSSRAKRHYAADEVARAIREPEIRALARDAASARDVAATARIPTDEGEDAVLEWQGGRYAVAAGTGLPGGSPTTDGALLQLRRALSRRSYAQLLLSATTGLRDSLESKWSSLVRGLAQPNALTVRPTKSSGGESVDVEVPGGHLVRLKREGGLWRIDDVR